MIKVSLCTCTEPHSSHKRSPCCMCSDMWNPTVSTCTAEHPDPHSEMRKSLGEALVSPDAYPSRILRVGRRAVSLEVHGLGYAFMESGLSEILLNLCLCISFSLSFLVLSLHSSFLVPLFFESLSSLTPFLPPSPPHHLSDFLGTVSFSVSFSELSLSPSTPFSYHLTTTFSSCLSPHRFGQHVGGFHLLPFCVLSKPRENIFSLDLSFYTLTFL